MLAFIFKKEIKSRSVVSSLLKTYLDYTLVLVLSVNTKRPSFKLRTQMLAAKKNSTNSLLCTPLQPNLFTGHCASAVAL